MHNSHCYLKEPATPWREPLNLQEDRLHLILDSLPTLVAILDTRERYRFANRQHIAWFGEDPDALTGRHVGEVIGERAYDTLRDHCEKALGGETSSFAGEVYFASGGERFIHGSCVPLRTDHGELEGILVQCSDLTELQWTRDALDATTVRGQTILDTAVDGIVTIDEMGIIRSCNKSIERLFGYSAGELIGRNVKKLMPPAHAADHDGHLRRYRETGEKHIVGIGREVTARRKDGSEFPVHLAVGEFVEGGRSCFTGFIRDMSEQKEMEQKARAHLEQLSHVTRLSAIDNLASGISHEINQPLTAIVTMAQAMLRALHAGRKEPAMLEDTLERIVKQGARANSIVQQMREFARKEKSTERTPQGIDVIVRDVLQLLEYEIRQYDITLNAELNTPDVLVPVNRIQIEQVLLNLIQNAVHAMAEIASERVLTIRTRPPRDDYPYMDVVIEDTGIGLPQNSEANVFDPFFTTKEQGMGQGLSISRSIVESHGGRISAGAGEHGGAVFQFMLPVGAGVDA